jgi:hypothetical protein
MHLYAALRRVAGESGVGRHASAALAMQKVVGSNPISRFSRVRDGAARADRYRFQSELGLRRTIRPTSRETTSAT